MISNLHIRQVEESELEKLLELCEAHAAYEKLPFSRNSQKERWKNDLFSINPKFSCLVAEYQSQIVGYATYMRQYATWDAGYYLYLDCLFVNESHRNCGVGERMMEEVKSAAQKNDCSLIQWQTPDFNTRAMKFYYRIGASSKNKERFFLNV